ncbi:cyclic nucleotide-binding domain-containing protein [Aliamphritea spongicola]|nr:cyclic nucleotide-binding domain-containing protein [Aliamphritea spongicola]
MLPEILQQYPEIQVPADQTVLSQGQHCENCFVITQGCVKVFGRSAEGRELVLYRINSGEICVLTTACLLSNDSFPAEAISETAVTARVIPCRIFAAYWVSLKVSGNSFSTVSASASPT